MTINDFNYDINYDINNYINDNIFSYVIILLIFIISAIIIQKSKRCNSQRCVIPNCYYPEIQNIVDNKDHVLDELSDIIINENWFTCKSNMNDNENNENNKTRLGDDQSLESFNTYSRKTTDIRKCINVSKNI